MNSKSELNQLTSEGYKTEPRLTSPRSSSELKNAQRKELLKTKEQERIKPFIVLEDHNSHMRDIFREFIEGGNTWVDTDNSNLDVQGRLVVLENPVKSPVDVAVCLLTYTSSKDGKADDGDAQLRFAFIPSSRLDSALNTEGYPFEGIPDEYIVTQPGEYLIPRGDFIKLGNYFTEPASVTLFGATAKSFNYSEYKRTFVGGLREIKEIEDRLYHAQIASAMHAFNPHLEQSIRKFDLLNDDIIESLLSNAKTNGGFAA